MDNSANFKINLEFLGLGNANKAEQSLKAVAEACIDLTGLTEPLAKITKVLESIDRTLLKIGGDAQKSAGHLEKMRADSALGLGKLISIEDKVAQGFENIGGKAKKAGKDVRKSFEGSLSMDAFSFNNIVGAVQNIAGMVAPIFEEGMMRETAATNFGTLLKGEGKDGKAFADELRGTDAAALYGTSTVNENAQAMLAYGVDSDTTMEVLSAIGDIAMGDKQKMSSLATAFSQMSALGKLQTQDWKQMVGAGFDPLKQMEEDLKIGREELDAMMSKGQITGDMVKQAFVNATQGSGQFAGALKNVMDNTFQGKMATLAGAIDDIKARLYDLALPIVMKVVPVITDQLIPAFMSVVDFISPVFDLIADNLDTVGVFVGVLGALAAMMEVVNIVTAANPVVWLIVAFAAQCAIIYKCVQAYDEWGAILLFLMGPLGVIVQIFMTISRYWDKLVLTFKSSHPEEFFKTLGACILDFVLYPLQQLLGIAAKLTGWEWVKDAQNGINSFRNMIGAIDPEKKEEKESTSETSSMDSVVAAVNSNTGGGSGSADLANATGKGKESVASGGTRNTQITINLGNMVENVNFQGGVDDNKDSLTSQLEECLLRVLYSATSAV